MKRFVSYLSFASLGFILLLSFVNSLNAVKFSPDYSKTSSLGNPCIGDFNLDGRVDGRDLSVILGLFGKNVSAGSSGDLNGDGRVDGFDISVFLNAFGSVCETPVFRPNGTNTGPINVSDLVSMQGDLQINSNGQILENFDLTGSLTIAANNVVVRNFRINDGGNNKPSLIKVNEGFSGIVIENGELVAPFSDNGVFGSGFVARRLHIHNMRTDAFGVGSNVVIEKNYVHDIAVGHNPNCNDNSPNPLDRCIHADVIQTRGNSANVIVKNNNFDVNNHVSGVIQMNDNGGQAYSISNWSVEGNWVDGSAVMFRSYSSQSIRYLNNKIGRHAVYGVLFNFLPVYDANSILNNGVSWRCNVWLDSGLVEYPKGANGQVIDPYVEAGDLVYPQDTC